MLETLNTAVNTPTSGSTLAGGVVGTVTAVSVCGNSVCETGERCITETECRSCARQDCPYIAKSCPTPPWPSSGTCGGHGRCFGASGACACFESQGYVGRACDECAAEYAMDPTTHECKKLVETRDAASSVKESIVSKVDAAMIAGAAIGGLFALGAVLYCIKKRICKKDISKGTPAPPVREAEVEGALEASLGDISIDVPTALPVSEKKAPRPAAGPGPLNIKIKLLCGAGGSDVKALNLTTDTTFKDARRAITTSVGTDTDIGLTYCDDDGGMLTIDEEASWQDALSSAKKGTLRLHCQPNLQVATLPAPLADAEV